MLTPFVFFAVMSLVLVYMVGKYRRLPSAEFASRIRSAGTGRALRALALAAPGFLASMLFMTGACGLVLLSGSDPRRLGAGRRLAPGGWVLR